MCEFESTEDLVKEVCKLRRQIQALNKKVSDGSATLLGYKETGDPTAGTLKVIVGALLNTKIELNQEEDRVKVNAIVENQRLILPKGKPYIGIESETGEIRVEGRWMYICTDEVTNTWRRIRTRRYVLGPKDEE